MVTYEPLTAERVAELKAAAEWLRSRLVGPIEAVPDHEMRESAQGWDDFRNRANPGAIVELCDCWEARTNRGD